MKQAMKKKLFIFAMSIFILGMIGATTATTVISIAPSGTKVMCYGYVRGPSGNPISGATVVLKEYYDGMVLDSTTTNSLGYYSVSDYTIYSKFKLTASATGYNPSMITIYSTGTFRKDFSLSQTTYTIRVYGAIKDYYSDLGRRAIVKLGLDMTSNYEAVIAAASGAYDISFTSTSTSGFILNVINADNDILAGKTYSTYGSYYQRFAIKEEWDIVHDYDSNSGFLTDVTHQGEQYAKRAEVYPDSYMQFYIKEEICFSETKEINIDITYFMNYMSSPGVEISFGVGFYDIDNGEGKPINWIFFYYNDPTQYEDVYSYGTVHLISDSLTVTQGVTYSILSVLQIEATHPSYLTGESTNNYYGFFYISYSVF